MRIENAPRIERFEPDRLIELWKAGIDSLPKQLTRASNREAAPVNTADLIDERLDLIDLYSDNESKYNKEMNDEARGDLAAGLYNMGILYKSFETRAAIELEVGTLSSATRSAIVPFAIDKGYDGAWSQMCEELPNEVKRVIQDVAGLEEGGPTSYEKIDINRFKSDLRTLGAFLDKKGVSPRAFMDR